MKTEYTVNSRVPTLAEYIELCHAVGWSEYINFEVAEQSLSQSIAGVVVQDKDDIVGMGRIVGDGSIYFYIQDIAVKPEHQNQGVGRMIMTTLVQYVKSNAPEKAFVGLFASAGKEAFYNQYGFHNHAGMTGMFGVIHKRELK
ncbi:N-acetyltransferase [Paenibacillus sp. 598K]|uniref:GNAT family N-acetyltransferase n=1 Tax=Paenibacillus sp. 598K TaxID=1117987 RepID=UPI000FFA66F0|nr:GNAT family N-acetyltransferase [Paenibacillus sp. 598K]GBF77766.1 N-acetyltransferase [Paenibacillus sp. 598K]